jgi:alpha-1,2-rhamnosyltransferase
MRLLLECTYVFDHPYVNSGIQRVVRNVIHNLGSLDEGIECLPVVLKNEKVYAVRKLAPGVREQIVSITQEWFENTRNHHWLLYHRISDSLKLKKFSIFETILKNVFRMVSFLYILPFGLVLLALSRQRIHARTNPWFLRRKENFWSLHQRLEANLGLLRKPVSRWIFRQIFRLGSLAFIVPSELAKLMAGDDIDLQRAFEIKCCKEDVLVLLDSSWHDDFFSHAERLRSAGVGIVSVIYDLIPLTHPQFCDAPLVKVFDHWFEWVANIADGFIAISETISNQVREDIIHRLGPEEADKRWYGHFHLGSELDNAQQTGRVRQRVQALFSNNSSIYLMVGTIEPRKNHDYLLDAFEFLWSAGYPVTLCIVGRIGWKCAQLIARIRRHTELGRRLFMFNDLSDTELTFCYRNSKALVFPSHVEGFGLPVVEAMQCGLPVLASDIPVFHEIGGEFIAYFDLNNPSSLAELVRKFEYDGTLPALKNINEWQWPGWRDSTRQLIQSIALHARNQSDQAR